MATSKPRITVTLSPRQYEVIRSISQNSGQSMSAFVSELLEQSLPVLERMAETFRKIKTAQDEQKRRIVIELDQAQSEVEPVLAQVIGQFDLFMSRIESASGVGGVDAKHPPARPIAQPTPVTNRGVTPSPEKGRKRPTGGAFSPTASRRPSLKKSGG